MAYLARFASGSVFLGDEVAVAQGMPGSSCWSLETAAGRVSGSSLQWAIVAVGGTAASSV
jgi:D-serine deaminase-like pyridoxal phosphate-dependent protein